MLKQVQKYEAVKRAYSSRQADIIGLIVAMKDCQGMDLAGSFAEAVIGVGPKPVELAIAIDALGDNPVPNVVVPLIVKLGKAHALVHLAAINALEKIRENSSEMFAEEIDQSIKEMLDCTMDIDVIAQIREKDSSSHFIPGLYETFKRADARQMSAVPYTEVFGQAVRHVEARADMNSQEGNALKALLDRYPKFTTP